MVTAPSFLTTVAVVLRAMTEVLGALLPTSRLT